MKPGFHVCLYKRKGQPIITAYVQNDEAEISMSLDDFIAEMKAEIGSVTWTIREKTFSEQMDRAVREVILNMKKGAASRII